MAELHLCSKLFAQTLAVAGICCIDAIDVTNGRNVTRLPFRARGIITRGQNDRLACADFTRLSVDGHADADNLVLLQDEVVHSGGDLDIHYTALCFPRQE